MTTGTKLHMTLNNLESCITDFKNFALETEDENARKQFSDYAAQLENIAQGFKGRVNYVESQEPQYKVYQQAQQKQQ
ncbi:MAG: DUF1657 domain-containing protein [Clostridia bacterium]|nr:DUF1657 domain-containing protein [Clostridia bacterium]